MKPKLRLIGAIAALATLALAVSCRGFFVNPTISTIAVSPANQTIFIPPSTNNTIQMTAFGTYNDGSTGNPSVTWSISATPTNAATISAGGLVSAGTVTGTASVTATSTQNPTITGTQTVTVSECVTSITLTPTSGTVTNNNPTFPITAMAAPCGGGTSTNVNQVATWNTSNSSLATVSAGTVTIAAGLSTGQGGTVTITATIGTVTSNTATITVSP